MVVAVEVLSLLHLVSAIVATSHAVLRHPLPRGAALWVMLVWLVPWVGPLLYLLVGVNRIPRAAQGFGASPTHPSVPMGGNAVHALAGGDVAYAAMIDTIRQSKRTVFLETYIFDDDEAGRLFADAMADAVSRGVAVLVLVDAIGARYSRPTIVKRLRKGGISTARFHPSAMPWRWPYSNLRNHRKVLVVDGEIAFTGGMNIRSACMASLKPTRPVVDLHFCVQGPAVAELGKLFVQDWELATGDDFPCVFDTDPKTSGSVSAELVVGGPDRSDEPIRWSKLASLVRAKKRAVIVTPYFVPNEDVMTAVCTARYAGVEVDLFVPEKNNLALVGWASRASWSRLLRVGVNVHLVPPPFEHTKFMIVDDDVAIIGSSNWDERSFRLNFEADLECTDTEFVAQLDAFVEERREASRLVTLEELSRLSLIQRLLDGLTRLATPYL